MNRFRQVVHYAWEQSKDLASEAHQPRLSLFFDMIRCYQKYRMWTNEYIKEKFYEKSPQERSIIGLDYLKKGKVRDAWQKDFRKNRKFLIKYSNVKYEKASLREKRNKAYTKRFHAGNNLFVEYDVNISRQHYLDGTISIGNNVLFAKHVFIDYSGELIIHDNVKISDGVNIETHSHSGFTSFATGSSKKEKLEIFEFVNLGAKSIITESCHKIGRYAKIGAGTVIRCNIPPYAIVVGNPARIIGFLFSPEEMSEFEKTHYLESERTSMEKYTSLYLKYYKNRLKNIKEFHKL
jgi:acetyltransferase-like isoleucine patch superfamily enzyme